MNQSSAIVLEAFMRLSHRVYDRILRILPALYALKCTRDFFTSVVRLLPEVIEADGYGWFVHSFHPRARMVDFVESEPGVITPAMIPRMCKSVESHPFSQHWMMAKEISALRLSDLSLSLRERFLAEKWDYHRYMGREYLTRPVSFQNHLLHAVSLRRDRKSFSEADRLAINLLAPHLSGAHENALAYERATSAPPNSTPGLGLELSRRESEVAFWLAEGKTNPEIGLILGISARTVEKHVEHILRKLGVENRSTAAVQIATALLASRPQHDASPDEMRSSSRGSHGR